MTAASIDPHHEPASGAPHLAYSSGGNSEPQAMNATLLVPPHESASGAQPSTDIYAWNYGPQAMTATSADPQHESAHNAYQSWTDTTHSWCEGIPSHTAAGVSQWAMSGASQPPSEGTQWAAASSCGPDVSEPMRKCAQIEA